jgi:hypothetical protein
MTTAGQKRARTRRFWLYGMAAACALVLGFHAWSMARFYVPWPRSFGQEFLVEFEWDSVEGVRTFRVADFNGSHVLGPLWQSLVAVQAKPRVNAYLKPSQLRHVRGGATVFVTNVIPVVYPDSWGSDGFVIHGRIEIGSPKAPQV